jgi:hypothetical protein
MKWTKKERFPDDKLESAKDETSEKVKGIGSFFRASGSKRSTEKTMSDEALAEPTHNAHEVSISNIDPELVLSPASITEEISNQAKLNTSTTEYTPLEVGTLSIEKSSSYYSHFFTLTPNLITNRGCIRVGHKNFDYLQIIQRN